VGSSRFLVGVYQLTEPRHGSFQACDDEPSVLGNAGCLIVQFVQDQLRVAENPFHSSEAADRRVRSTRPAVYSSASSAGKQT
jgi:hypothetical protein